MNAVVKSLRVVLVLGLMSGTQAQLISPEAALQPKPNLLGTWRMVDERPPTLGDAQGRAVIIVFRQQAAGQTNPINLYINGHYQASLIGNSYTEAFLCPGEHVFGTAISDHTGDIHTRVVERGELVAGHHFFKAVIDEAGHSKLIPTTHEEARSQATSLSFRQRHTLPRYVSKPCDKR